MTNISFKKSKISIQNIGKQRFWFGILAGIISAFSISLFFNQSREVLRFFTGMSFDLLILENKELAFFNYFFASLSTVLGLAITLWIWMGNRTRTRKMGEIYKQLSRTNTILIFWLVLMMTARFGSIISFGILNNGFHLDLLNDYWLLFVLIPIVVFTQSWFTVRLVYRSGKWILLSLLTCLITAFTLSKTTNVDQEKINNIYFLRFEKDHDYIIKEVTIAKEKYGIEYETKAIETLKNWYTENSIEQVDKVKTSFRKNTKVSMDTIILQKIIIHNFKTGNWRNISRNSFENWHYAFPKDILRQIGYFKTNSNETKELFNTLKEQIELVNAPEIEWDDYNSYTETEIRRSNGVKYHINDFIISQLKYVRDSLTKVERYSELNKTLPKINNEK